jgi:secondary thiamine-phosphate synthase enzyme
MRLHQARLSLRPPGPGLHEFTPAVARELAASGLRRGLVSVFCRHTSASLVVMENADPSARRDLEAWLDRLVPAGDPRFTHTLEGPDDMPSHVKMALTRTSEQVPFADGRLLLGSWQGVFLWEHRAEPPAREIVLSFVGE